MEDAESTAVALDALKALGVSIAIDDFGTGYSSLLFLRSFPVDFLKIDRSFVTGLGHEPGSDAIVSGIIGLAQGLGIEVVAEGVETAEQREWLRAIGCEYAQGHYFSWPLPDEAATRFLAGYAPGG